GFGYGFYTPLAVYGFFQNGGGICYVQSVLTSAEITGIGTDLQGIKQGDNSPFKVISRTDKKLTVKIIPQAGEQNQLQGQQPGQQHGQQGQQNQQGQQQDQQGQQQDQQGQQNQQGQQGQQNQQQDQQNQQGQEQGQGQNQEQGQADKDKLPQVAPSTPPSFKI